MAQNKDAQKGVSLHDTKPDFSALESSEVYLPPSAADIPEDIVKFVESGYEHWKMHGTWKIAAPLSSETEVKEAVRLARKYADHRNPPLTVRVNSVAMKADKTRLVYKITDKQIRGSK